jgi:predicted alpha/beta superfamily hydrolase
VDLAGVQWRSYVEGRTEHSVVGDLRVLEQVESKELGNARDVLVLLPPSYGESKRDYPVLYMQDGQNLFDRMTSFAGEWGVDETMQALSREGIEAIVVGVGNTGASRIDEYSPFEGPRGGGKGDAYLRFLLGTVKPLVDAEFRTSRDRMSTGILGSSLGGLIALHAFFTHPDVFGLVGALSPSLFYARGAILERAATAAPIRGGRVYVDVGTREGPMSFFRRAPHVARVRDLQRILKQKGYRDGVDLEVVVDRGGRHNEADWGRRLPEALRFLWRLRGPLAKT